MKLKECRRITEVTVKALGNLRGRAVRLLALKKINLPNRKQIMLIDTSIENLRTLSLESCF